MFITECSALQTVPPSVVLNTQPGTQALFHGNRDLTWMHTLNAHFFEFKRETHAAKSGNQLQDYQATSASLLLIEQRAMSHARIKTVFFYLASLC